MRCSGLFPLCKIRSVTPCPLTYSTTLLAILASAHEEHVSSCGRRRNMSNRQDLGDLICGDGNANRCDARSDGKPVVTKVPIRYPGGKQRFLAQIIAHLPRADEIKGRFVEPFFGGGAVFFALQPMPSVLNDLNPELINLYRGIRHDPEEVWRRFSTYPASRRAYYRVRQQIPRSWGVVAKAARTLYLNRTCFKGMWRQNSRGMFNVGYGGQSRRWAISEVDLIAVAKALRGTKLTCSDFEPILDDTTAEDFVFMDPPYHPGRRESPVEHYLFSQFTYGSHQRLEHSRVR